MLSPLHYLNASADEGRFSNQGEHPGNPAQVDAIFEHLQQNNIRKLTLHFHGGLVTENRGLEVAEMLEGKYNGTSHIVTVVWGTGFFETVKENLNSITATTLFKELRDIVLKKVGKHLGIEDGSKGIAEMTEVEIQTELESTNPFEDLDQKARDKAQNLNDISVETTEADIEAELNAELDMDHPLVEAVVTEGPEDPYYKSDHLVQENQLADGSKGPLSLAIIKPLASVAIRVIKRFWKKTDHDIYPTIVEEILREFYIAEFGENLWGDMKRKAADLWKDNTGLQGDQQHAGRYFLEALLKHKKQNPALMLDVVGHSAGAVATCEMLKCMASEYPDLLPVRNVFFLAPACRYDLFVQEMVDHRGRYQQFKMFTMDDPTERKDQCVPFVYTHSLLYLISGILEKNADDEYILGMQRYLTDEKPYREVSLLQKVKKFLDKEKAVISSPSPTNAPEGMRTDAKKHGDFDNNCLTTESLLYLINQ